MSIKNFLATPRMESQYSPSEVIRRIRKAENLGVFRPADVVEEELRNAITQSRMAKYALGFCASLAFYSIVTTDHTSTKLACIPAAAFFAVLANDARRNQRDCAKGLKDLRIPAAFKSPKI